MFQLVFSRRFAMAHRLTAGASEKCAIPHGHNETVTVTLRAARPERLDGHANMVEPFERDPVALEGLDFRYFSVQPMDSPDRLENTRLAVAFCLARPKWRLGIQTHKHLGIR